MDVSSGPSQGRGGTRPYRELERRHADFAAVPFKTPRRCADVFGMVDVYPARKNHRLALAAAFAFSLGFGASSVRAAESTSASPPSLAVAAARATNEFRVAMMVISNSPALARADQSLLDITAATIQSADDAATDPIRPAMLPRARRTRSLPEPVAQLDSLTQPLRPAFRTNFIFPQP